MKADGQVQISTDLSGGSSYTVSVATQPTGQNCAISNGTGSVGIASGNGIDVTCTSTKTVVYNFVAGSKANSSYSTLISDSAGNLYGTATGGAYGNGVVYQITPAGVENDIYSFGAVTNDGSGPTTALIMDSAGNFYGATQSGGAYGNGTIFKLTPAGNETILYSFGAVAGDGSEPIYGLTMDAAGNLYGTTLTGGASSYGTVFELSTTGVETILHSFTQAGTDGFYPEGSVLLDASGNLYGATVGGGTGVLGHGTIYKVDSSGNYSILYSFGQTATDAAEPQAGVVMDAAGNLYGTTVGGGTNGDGTVFKLDTSGNETVLYSFGANNTDGVQPQCQLILDPVGNLFGTTESGGSSNLGTVFVLTPDGTESILISFDTLTTGAYPQTGLYVDANGNLFGTTVNGGGPGWGTIFEIY